MPWLTIIKHLIPYIWDVFIKQYDEDGNPVLWSKTMIIGTIVVIIALYYNLYSFIHNKTDMEHSLNVKNKELILDLKTKKEDLEKQVIILTKERDEARQDELRTKATLSEARLDIIQLNGKLMNCSNKTPDPPMYYNNTNKTTKNKNDNKKTNDLDLILRGAP